MNKLITKGDKVNVADWSFLREFWGNNHGHGILSAEVDSVTTDVKQLLEDYGLVGCHSNKSNCLSVHTRIDSSGHVRLLWESNEEEDKGLHAAIFEVKFGTKAEGSFTDSRERTAGTLFSDLESVASAIEGVDPKDNVVPTANCVRDTKERRLVTRSGIQCLRCCECHLHHQRAMRLVLFENSSIRCFNRCTTLR